MKLRLIYIALLGLSACAAPVTKETPPACLNVQEGERHVEFDGRNLLLAEEGSPKTLSIESGEGVRCERLEILRNEPGAVLIEYSIGPTRKVGIAKIRDATWIQKPKPTK